MPNQQGYYQLALLFTTFPIIPDNAPVRGATVNGNINVVQSLFEQELASPKYQDSDGYILLHICITSVIV